MRTVASALTLSVLLASYAALASETDFAKADTNGDGEVDLAEVLAAYPGTAGDRFEESDVNGSKGLDLKEFTEALESGMLSQ